VISGLKVKDDDNNNCLLSAVLCVLVQPLRLLRHNQQHRGDNSGKDGDHSADRRVCAEMCAAPPGFQSDKVHTKYSENVPTWTSSWLC